jgi:Kyakuja-Dileera-Zisupton transposase
MSSNDREDKWKDVLNDDIPSNSEDIGGNPTDDTETTAAIEGCVHNWKAAQSNSKKKSWKIFEENGLFTSACHHELILWIMDMVWSGEL